MKRLYRSRTERMWLGVMGGIAQFFNTDPTLVRLVWVLLVVITGIIPGLLAYFIGAIIVPEEPARAEEASKKAE